MMEDEWWTECLTSGRQGGGCTIGLWQSSQVVRCADQQYCAIWHAAAPMDTTYSPVFGGELHANVGFCTRGGS